MELRENKVKQETATQTPLPVSFIVKETGDKGEEMGSKMGSQDMFLFQFEVVGDSGACFILLIKDIMERKVLAFNRKKITLYLEGRCRC